MFCLLVWESQCLVPILGIFMKQGGKKLMNYLPVVKCITKMGLQLSKDIGTIISIAVGIESAASSVVAVIGCFAFFQQDLRWLKMLLFHAGVRQAAELLALSLFTEATSFTCKGSIYAKARLAYLGCSLIAAAGFAYSRQPREPPEATQLRVVWPQPPSIQEIDRQIREASEK